MKIAIIGEKDTILGFKPLGFETYPVIDAKEAEERLKTLAQDRDYATIYITESLSSQIKELIAGLSKFSNIVVVPGKGETLGLASPVRNKTPGASASAKARISNGARERLKKISEKALGTDIISSEQKSRKVEE